MAKTVKENNSLFTGFKPPKLDSSDKKTVQKTEKKVEKKPTPQKEVEKIENEAEIIPSPQKKDSISVENSLKTADVKKSGGRPKKYDETTKTVKIFLSEDNYRFIKKNGWEYGGMIGYIEHLIIEERKRLGE